MKKKRETCKYCGEKMDAKTTRQEFCSPKCRVYWNRENERPDTQQWVNNDLKVIPKNQEPKEDTAVTVQLKQPDPTFQNEMDRMIWEAKQEFLNKNK